MKEIGAEEGVMESYVSKIHAKPILKMKAAMMDGRNLLLLQQNRPKYALLNDVAERKAPKSLRDEHNALRPIAAMQLSKTR